MAAQSGIKIYVGDGMPIWVNDEMEPADLQELIPNEGQREITIFRLQRIIRMLTPPRPVYGSGTTTNQ